MNNGINKTSWLVLLTYWASLTTSLFSPFTPVYGAVLNAGSDAGKFSIKCGGGECRSCTDFCKKLDGKGISGTSTWDGNDDALCTAVGAPTVNGQSRTLPTPNPSFASCGVNVPDEIVAATRSSNRFTGNDVCIKAQEIKDMCTFHNSQIQVQCQAVNAVSGGSTSASTGGGTEVGTIEANIGLAAADFAVAAACVAAAMAPDVGVAVAACTALGVAEGVAEMGYTLSQASNSVTVYMEGIGGGAGIAAAAGTGFAGNAARNAAKNTGDDAVEAMVKNGMEKELAEKASKTAAEKKAQAESTTKTTAMITAGIFSALGALRIYNTQQMKKTLGDACDAADGLLSANGGTSGGGGGGGGGNNQTFGASGSGGSTSGGSGSGSGSSSSGGAISADQAGRLFQCISGGGSKEACAAATSAATAGPEGALLGSNPAGNQLLQSQLPNLPAIAQKALEGGAGAALASALPAEAGATGAALAAMADDVQAHGGKLSSLMGISSGSYGGGGGGGAGAAKSESSNPFASLFGGGAGAGAGAIGAGIASFGKGPQAPDIWHANSRLNLFQIVSEKIERVTTRVK